MFNEGMTLDRIVVRDTDSPSLRVKYCETSIQADKSNSSRALSIRVLNPYETTLIELINEVQHLRVISGLYFGMDDMPIMFMMIDKIGIYTVPLERRRIVKHPLMRIEIYKKLKPKGKRSDLEYVDVEL